MPELVLFHTLLKYSEVEFPGYSCWAPKGNPKCYTAPQCNVWTGFPKILFDPTEESLVTAMSRESTIWLSTVKSLEKPTINKFFCPLPPAIWQILLISFMDCVRRKWWKPHTCLIYRPPILLGQNCTAEKAFLVVVAIVRGWRKINRAGTWGIDLWHIFKPQ